MRVLRGGMEAGEASGLVGLWDLNRCGTICNCDPEIRASDFPSVKSGTEEFRGLRTNWKNLDFAQKMARPAGLEPATF